MRFYDLKDDFFRLERKDTVGNLKQKASAPMSGSQVTDLLEGRGFPADGADDLLNEAYMLQIGEGLRPVTIVDYRRTAFTYPAGNIRITFDKDISCGMDPCDLLSKDAVLIPVLPYGMHVLEVKYDGILPGYIAKLLDLGNLARTSFSKYVYARNVMENNGYVPETL